MKVTTLTTVSSDCSFTRHLGFRTFNLCQLQNWSHSQSLDHKSLFITCDFTVLREWQWRCPLSWYRVSLYSERDMLKEAVERDCPSKRWLRYLTNVINVEKRGEESAEKQILRWSSQNFSYRASLAIFFERQYADLKRRRSKAWT